MNKDNEDIEKEIIKACAKCYSDFHWNRAEERQKKESSDIRDAFNTYPEAGVNDSDDFDSAKTKIINHLKSVGVDPESEWELGGLQKWEAVFLGRFVRMNPVLFPNPT